jgi:hypothetical protein
MISMIDKIIRLGIEECDYEFKMMKVELKTNLKEFLYGKYIQNFEKKWMEKYLL